MALKDLEEIRKAVESLTQDEKLELAEFLISTSRQRHATAEDLEKFRGTIRITVDPLEFQRQMRSEWP